MNTRTLLLVGMVLLAALARLLPHPPNFTPIGAMALFGAAHFRSKWTAFLAPLTAMFISDLALELTTRLNWLAGWLAHGRGFHADMLVIDAAICLIVAIGIFLQYNRTVWSVGGAVLASSMVFFLITNFWVWLRWDMYPMTWAGLVACYVAAIPFFHWTLLGDAFYASVLFGGFAFAEKKYPSLQLA